MTGTVPASSASMVECDFLVIGAGIAGASAAWALAEHGSVVVLERETSAGYHTTGRSAAQFLESYGNLSTRCLTRGGRPFFESPPDGFTDMPLLSPRAAMFFAREDQLDTLHALHATVSALTPEVALIDAKEACEFVPAMRIDYVAEAMLEPDSMDIDVNALHQGFLRGARRRGVRIVLDAGVESLQYRHPRWEADTCDGRYAAKAVVNAAGAWCDEVARLAGAQPIGLVPKRRTVFTFDPPAGSGSDAWPLGIDVDEELFFKPDAGRLMCSAADETPSPPCDAQPEDLDIAIAVDRLGKATTLEVNQIVSRWAGLRSFVSDHSLVIGPDADLEGFHWVAGQGGYGIQTSPAVARTIAALATGGDVPDDLLALGLRRSDIDPARLQTGLGDP